MKLVRKHPLAIRWFHWINFPVITLMVWSGLLIYWANRAYGIRIGGRELVGFFPDKLYERVHMDARLAEGMSWHFLFMWFFLINGLLYVTFVAVSGQWRFLLPPPSALKESIQVVLHDLHLRKTAPPQGKYNAAQKIAYTGVIVLGLIELLTGLAIYKPTQLGWLTSLMGGYGVARFLHFWVMMALVAFFVVHILQVLRAGWNNFRSMVTGVEVQK